MNKHYYLLLALLIFGAETKSQVLEDFEIAQIILTEMENKDLLAIDIYPRIPPPPESREYFANLRTELSKQESDSLFSRFESRYEEHLLNIKNRRIDSSQIIVATINYLISSCSTCGIRPDSLLEKEKYNRYKKLVKQLKQGRKKPIPIPFESLVQKGKYVLKSINDFPPDRTFYDGNLNFLCAGDIFFSRFYHKGNVGLMYYDYSYCKMGCGAGYLVLLEHKNDEWQIMDILLQSID